MKNFTIIYPSGRHNGFRSDSVNLPVLNYGPTILEGIWVDSGNKHAVRIGSDLLPIPPLVSAEARAFKPHGNESIELCFVSGIGAIRGEFGQAVLVADSNPKFDALAFVLVKVEPTYKANMSIRQMKNSKIETLRRVTGHKAEWDEGLVTLGPGGSVVLEEQWGTRVQRGISRQLIKWDGEKLTFDSSGKTSPG